MNSILLEGNLTVSWCCCFILKVKKFGKQKIHKENGRNGNYGQPIYLGSALAYIWQLLVESLWGKYGKIWSKSETSFHSFLSTFLFRRFSSCLHGAAVYGIFLGKYEET